MRKITSKILLIHFIFACAAIFLILFISYRTVNSILLEHASSLGTACAEIEAKEIESFLKEKINLLESISTQIESAEANDEASLKKILENARKADPSFYSFFIGFEDGRFIDANGWLPAGNYNIFDRPWYREAIDKNGIAFTSVYVDQKKNTQVKSIAMPIQIQGKNAVLAANIPFDAIRKQIESIHFGKTGYCILIDGDGMVLVHPQKNNEMKPLEVVQRDLNMQTPVNVLKDQKGTAVIKFGKKEELLVHVPINSSDWKLLLLAPIEEFQGPARKMFSQLITMILILLGFIVFISFLLGQRLNNTEGKEIVAYENGNMGDTKSLMDNDAARKADTEKSINGKAPARKEVRISGTEEVYGIAGQIDEIAIQLEEGIKSFKTRKE